MTGTSYLIKGCKEAIGILGTGQLRLESFVGRAHFHFRVLLITATEQL